MSGARCTDSTEALREESEKCSEECSDAGSEGGLVEACEELVDELNLTASTKFGDEGEDECEEVENLLLHGHRSDLKWSMKERRQMFSSKFLNWTFKQWRLAGAVFYHFAGDS